MSCSCGVFILMVGSMATIGSAGAMSELNPCAVINT